MGWTNNAKDGMLTQVRGRVTDLSIHTADPTTVGDNEVTGGSPAYARVAVTAADFTVANDGAFTLNNDKPFSGPAGASATFYGAWDGVTFLGGGAITGDTLFNAEGDFVLKTGTAMDLNA